MEQKIEKLMQEIRTCAQRVLDELGPGWQESVFQKAMEVALRNRGIVYETQRILPITFDEHVIGESIPDLVVWLKEDGHKVAIVVDLKSDSSLKEEFAVQVERYIKELRKQVKGNESVHPVGMVINFVKSQNAAKITEGFEDLNGIQILCVNC